MLEGSLAVQQSGGKVECFIISTYQEVGQLP